MWQRLHVLWQFNYPSLGRRKTLLRYLRFLCARIGYGKLRDKFHIKGPREKIAASCYTLIMALLAEA